MEALCAGLAVADSAEAIPISIDLIELAVEPGPGLRLDARRARADEALESIVGLWDRLPAEQQALALSVGGARWSGAIEAVLREPTSIEETRSAASLAVRLDDAGLAGALVRALMVEDEAARASAEAGLVRLALRAAGVDGAWLGVEAGGALAEASRADGLSGRSSEAGSAGGLARESLERHVADATWGFAGHQRRLVLLAALALLDVCGLSRARLDERGSGGVARLRRLLQEPGHVAHRALRQVLRWSGAPLVRARALVLLCESGVREPAIERLTRADTVEEHEAVLCSWHLWRRPARTTALSEIEVRSERRPPSGEGAVQSDSGVEVPSGGVLPGVSMARDLSQEASVGLGLLCEVIQADDAVRGAVLEPMVEHPSARVRLGALGGLPRAGLGHYCFDAEESVARSAMLRWSTAGLGLRARAEGGERLRLATVLTRSPHHAVRRLARQEVERENPWLAWSAVSRASAWRLALRDRDALLTRARAMIREGAGTDDAARIEAAIAAVGMARRLGLVRLLGADLAELVGPGRPGASATDARLAATAASALGEVDDALGRTALRRALTHPDDRVRANAVESIGVQRLAIEDATTGRDRDYGTLIELKGDAHHRVRANAIRALLGAPPAAPKDRRAGRRGVMIEPRGRVYEPAAVDALSAMLTDSRAMHRLAGAWLAGRVLSGGRDRLGDAWTRFGAMMREMEASDPDTAVRRRAGLSARRAASAVRAGWAGSSEVVGAEDASGAILRLDAVEPAGIGSALSRGV